MANYATVGDRLVAVIIDSVILLVPLYVLAIAIPLGLFTFGVGFFPTLLFGPFILTWWVLALLYFTFFEGTTGQTLGKQAVSIKVLDEVSKKPVNMERALLRNILRIIDWFPFFYLIGFILVETQPQKKRLGDTLARTIVVKT